MAVPKPTKNEERYRVHFGEGGGISRQELPHFPNVEFVILKMINGLSCEIKDLRWQLESKCWGSSRRLSRIRSLWSVWRMCNHPYSDWDESSLTIFKLGGELFGRGFKRSGVLIVVASPELLLSIKEVIKQFWYCSCVIWIRKRKQLFSNLPPDNQRHGIIWGKVLQRFLPAILWRNQPDMY